MTIAIAQEKHLQGCVYLWQQNVNFPVSGYEGQTETFSMLQWLSEFKGNTGSVG